MTKPRILLVDDEEEVLDAFALLLGGTYDVVTATNGREALGVMDDKGFSAIVLDLMMPIMGGAAFKRELDRRGDETPVVIVSAAMDVEQQANDLGVADYLIKPVEIEDLERILTRLVDGALPS